MPCLSIMLLMMAGSTGFFLLTGLLLVLLAQSIKFLQQALSKGLGPSSGTKEWNHFSAAWTKTIAAGDLSCWSKPNRERATTEENGNCSAIFLVLHHSKNSFISLRYFFTVESALELSKQLNKELKSGLIAGGSTIHALLAITTCKKKLYHQNFTTTG